jgi:hypothetical protein
MDTRTHDSGDVPVPESEPVRVRRGSTGVRILLTLLFAVIWGALEALLGVAVVFSIAWALIAQQAPPERLRDLANSLVAYSYRIWRYLTYADSRVPFPFSDFPEPLEPIRDLGADSAPEVQSLLDARADDYGEDDD